MTEMQERVSRALAEAITGWSVDYLSFEKAARAAISAMREPTVEMCEAALWLEADTTSYEAAYTAMIDAALKVKP